MELKTMVEKWGLSLNDNIVSLVISQKSYDNGDEVDFQATYNAYDEVLMFSYNNGEIIVTTHEKWSLSDFKEYLQDESDEYDWEYIFKHMYWWRSISNMDELFSDVQGFCDEYFKDDKDFIKVEVINY